MSGGDITTLFYLWAATLTPHGDEPPFCNSAELYDTIDATPLGDVDWESFSIKYNSEPPQGESLPWMEAEYEFWFHNPRKLVQNLLSNPDFIDEFDYMPFHEYDADGKHHFQDFMSGDWAWKQAVSRLSIFTLLSLILYTGPHCC